MVETEQDWQAEAIRLKAEGKESAEIAEIVGKHAATVRKVIARARAAEPEVPFQPTSTEVHSSNGNGNGHHTIPGQTTVDDHLSDVPPEDDPEYADEGIAGQWERGERDPLDDFKAEAGEPVGPMPPREMDGGEPYYATQVKGTRQLAIDFGLHADLPIGGTLVVKSEKLASGHYGMGDLITGTFTARVTDIGGKERLDKDSEEFRAKPTAYVATITDLDLDG